MLLTLFDSNRQVKATFEPSESSTQDKEIQGDNLLKLSFTLHGNYSAVLTRQYSFL